jgi:hypothetical protein
MGGTGESNWPVGECKKKMENVLSAFKREKMKIKESRGLWKDEYF